MLQEAANPLGANNTSFLIPCTCFNHWGKQLMQSWSGNSPGKACGVHVCGGNGFIVTGLGGWEPNKSPVMAAKEIKCCPPSTECGSHTNGCQRKGFQAGESDTALQGVRRQKSPRGKENGIFIAWDTSSPTDKTLKINAGKLTEVEEVVWGLGKAWYGI